MHQVGDIMSGVSSNSVGHSADVSGSSNFTPVQGGQQPKELSKTLTAAAKESALGAGHLLAVVSNLPSVVTLPMAALIYGGGKVLEKRGLIDEKTTEKLTGVPNMVANVLLLGVPMACDLLKVGCYKLAGSKAEKSPATKEALDTKGWKNILKYSATKGINEVNYAIPDLVDAGKKIGEKVQGLWKKAMANEGNKSSEEQLASVSAKGESKSNELSNKENREIENPKKSDEEQLESVSSKDENKSNELSNEENREIENPKKSDEEQLEGVSAKGKNKSDKLSNKKDKEIENLKKIAEKQLEGMGPEAGDVALKMSRKKNKKLLEHNKNSILFVKEAGAKDLKIVKYIHTDHKRLGEGSEKRVKEQGELFGGPVVRTVAFTARGIFIGGQKYKELQEKAKKMRTNAEAMRSAKYVMPTHQVLLVTTSGHNGDVSIMTIASRGTETLQDAAKKMNLQGLIKATIQAAKGTAEFHAQGFVHGDLKDDNIMLDAKGNARIIDYEGMVKEGVKKDMHEVCGTPGFMAPEVMAGNLKSTYAMDVFSLGVMSFLLLAKEKDEVLKWQDPYSGKNDPSPLHDTIKGLSDPDKYPHLRELSQEKRESLKELLLSATATSPQERPTAEQFVAALEHIFPDSGVE
jgi:hypothetical protein